MERSARLCCLCDSGNIEDELHFMLVCSLYQDIRHKYLEPILEGCTQQCNWDKFIYIMQSEETDLINRCACYIHNAFSRRNAKFLNRT